jgi:hypothetical protein
LLGGVVFNENGADVDFRVEGDTNAHLLFADASADKIGINESSPSHKLVVGGDIGVGFTTPNDAARQINFNVNRGSAGQTLANINWQWNSKFVAQIRGIAGADTTNKDDAHLAFFTSAANNLVERFRILSDGKVGIGTTSPNTKLDVRDPSGTGISSRSTATQATDTNKGLKVRNNSDTDTFSVSYKGQGYFAGNVGIGTTSPSSNLHVESSSPSVRLSDSDNSSAFCLFDGNGANLNIHADKGNNVSNSTMGFGIDNSIKMTLNSSGFLGIGTTSPTNQLHVHDGTNANDTPEVKIESFRPTIRFKDKSTSSVSSEIVGDNSLKFRVSTPVDDNTALTERMRIDSSGNVGIGTASPAANLHLKDGSSNTEIKLQGGSSTANDIIAFLNSAGSTRGNITYDTDNNFLLFNVNTSERMRIDSSGNVGIGTTSPLKLLDVKEESNGTVEQYLRNTVINLLSKINGTTSAQFGTETSHPLAFLTGNTERMRIDSSGNMLLGLTSTSFPKRLNVQGSSGAIIALKNNDTTSYAANTNTSIEFGLNTGNTGNQNGSCEIRAFKENGTNGNNARGLSFYTGGNGGSPTERLRIESNGFVSGTYKPVKTVKNTNQDHTTGERFVIPLPNTSRMFKIAGTFSWSGSGSGIIFADFGDWSDGHTVNIEGVALSFRNGASEDLDDLGNTRYQRMTPAAFDAYNLEIQYEIFITSQALQNGNDTGNNAGGGRPGAFGHIRFTHSQIGVALTTFTFQDINATGTDRLQSFAWDIDGSTGNLGSGEHTYVLEEYPLT